MCRAVGSISPGAPAETAGLSRGSEVLLAACERRSAIGERLWCEPIQRDPSFLCLLAVFGLIAMHQSQKLIFFILFMAVTTVTAASEAIIQEKTYPIIQAGNECKIDTSNIHGCPFGWYEEKEWDVDNRPLAILEKGKPLTCIEPCIKLLQHEIWFNCTLLKYVFVKYTCRCIKDDEVNETVFLFRKSKIPKLEVTKHWHIGIGPALGITVLAVLSIWLKKQCKRTRRKTDNEAIV
uniref:uncharacterized protein n=1 Tax=Pristiophorus japonicus TaxID=55135 RepID=UPI00398F6863